MNTRASIRTRFRGPTNTLPSRVIAQDEPFDGQKPRSLSVAWDYGLSPDENHRAAAQAWLWKYNPGNVVKPPGLGFDHDYYWTWVPTGGEA